MVEFVNIREHCAWAHQDDPKGATRKAVQIISSAFTRAKLAPPVTLAKIPILPSALIVGGGLASTAAARALAARGYQVELVARQGLVQNLHEPGAAILPTAERLQEKNVVVRPWPDSLKLHGSPGAYEAVLEYGAEVNRVTAGAVLVDIGELNKGASPLPNTISDGGILRRIISRNGNTGFSSSPGGDLLREITIEETPGLFLLPPDGADAPDEQVVRGLATAARVSTYLGQASISLRATAVTIDAKLCRGCGDCAEICAYIEMRQQGDGTAYAWIDEALCLGCGACITSCPTDAIAQPRQSDKQIISTLRSMIHPGQMPREV